MYKRQGDRFTIVDTSTITKTFHVLPLPTEEQCQQEAQEAEKRQDNKMEEQLKALLLETQEHHNALLLDSEEQHDEKCKKGTEDKV